MTLKELEHQLLALSDTEKDHLSSFYPNLKPIQSQALKKRLVLVVEVPVSPAPATVWGLVASQRIGYSEADLLTSYPTLSATNLANAWEYAAAFPAEIEAEIAENNAVMDREI